MADADHKACRVCGLLLPSTSFHRNPTYANGLTSACKTCINKARSDRYHATKVLRPQAPIVSCEQCGAEFSRPITNPPRSTKYCSMACRFWAKVDRSGGEDACWPWTGKGRSNSGEGYGAFNADGKSARSHRMAWELTSGPIPAGLAVCHKCDNKLCCNPSHFFLGTVADNNADMRAKGRGWTMDAELVERLRLMKIGVPRSAETRAKLRLANAGKTPPNKGKASPKIAESKRRWWAEKKAMES